MPISRRSFIAQSSFLTAASTLLPRGVRAQVGAPVGAPDAYATPKPLIDGPFKPTWASIRDQHHTPAWFNPAKFGIFIHWGLYSIPARGNEWYIKHMYTSDVAWHTEHYGAPDKFGYKDFIPLFTVKKYDPSAWAELLRRPARSTLCRWLSITTDLPCGTPTSLRGALGRWGRSAT